MTGKCERCGGEIDDVNVKAWETTGRLLCEECADAAFETAAEDDGQPDERQEWADFDADC